MFAGLHSLPLDRLDFYRCHFAAENGEQDLTTLSPAFVRSILTAKPSALLRRLSVGFAVALPPRPRPLPKNRINLNEVGVSAYYDILVELNVKTSIGSNVSVLKNVSADVPPLIAPFDFWL